MQNVSALINSVSREYSEKIFLFDRESEIKYHQIPSAVSNIYSILKDKKIKKGEIVGICMAKSPMLCLVYITCFYAGFLALPLSKERVHREIVSLNLPVSAVITDTDINFTSMSTINLSKHNILKNSSDFLHYPDADPQETVYLNLTSGSTNRPKAARCSYESIFLNTKSVIEHFGFTDSDSHLCMFPAHLHPHEFFMRPLMTGGSAIVTENILPRDIPAILSSYRITTLMATPTIQKTMITYSRSPIESYRYTRLFEAGGMVTPPSLRTEFIKKTGIPITPVWGSTETLGVALSLNPKEPLEYNMIGSPIPGYDVYTKPLENSTEEGIMIIRSKGMMAGYYNCTDIDSTFMTNDIVVKKGNNYYFLGRADNMVKKGGMRIYPEELLYRIKKLPSLKDAALITIDHHLYGRDIILFAVPVSTIRIKDLKKELSNILEQHEIPHDIKILDNIPYLPSGKTDNKALREMI